MHDRIRETIMQSCAELGVHIVKGVLARDYFSTTSGNVTDDIIKQCLKLYSSK